MKGLRDLDGDLDGDLGGDLGGGVKKEKIQRRRRIRIPASKCLKQELETAFPSQSCETVTV